jgi:hypothetical protein
MWTQYHHFPMDQGVIIGRTIATLQGYLGYVLSISSHLQPIVVKPNNQCHHSVTTTSLTKYYKLDETSGYSVSTFLE